jgi:hypothetical protein
MIRSTFGDNMEGRAMTARLVELERERSDARDEAKVLLALQDAFTQIAVTRAPDDVIAHMLRAAFNSLGFSRAIFFAADRERGIEARWQVDGNDVVEPSYEAPDLRHGSAMLAALRSLRSRMRKERTDCFTSMDTAAASRANGKPDSPADWLPSRAYRTKIVCCWLARKS